MGAAREGLMDELRLRGPEKGLCDTIRCDQVAAFEAPFYKLQFLEIQIDLTTKSKVRSEQFSHPMGGLIFII